MKRLLLFLSFALLFANCAAARKDNKKKADNNLNYHITLTIDGNQDTMMLLGYYYAEGTYVLDTAFRDSKGQFEFASSTKNIPDGVYFFANSQGKYVEFVVYHEKPMFEFRTLETDWTKYMQVKGSRENELFYEFHSISDKLYTEATAKEHIMDSASYAKFFREQQKKMDETKIQFIANHPDCQISKMVQSTKGIDVPTTSADGTPLTDAERYDYYIVHAFDNMPLNEDMLIRTPRAVFYDRLNEFTEKSLYGAPPESINKALDTILDRAMPSKENFQYLLHHLTEKYLQSNIVIYEGVYVHLVQRYWETGKALWAEPSVVDEQIERANRWDKILIGKPAPQLILYDTLHNPHSLLHQASAHKYTLLIFWSPNCGHCQTAIPEVFNIYKNNKDKYDLSAFTILTDPDEPTVAQWKKFIHEHGFDWVNLNGGEANCDWHQVYDVTSTPQIYLLDNKGIIVGKKLGADNLLKLLEVLNKEESEKQ